MSYSIEIKKSAEKEMKKFPPKLFKRITSRILDLKENPIPFPNCRKLDKPLDGYRIRVGDYRVLYLVNDTTKSITIFKVMHRKEVYKIR